MVVSWADLVFLCFTQYNTIANTKSKTRKMLPDNSLKWLVDICMSSCWASIFSWIVCPVKIGTAAVSRIKANTMTSVFDFIFFHLFSGRDQIYMFYHGVFKKFLHSKR